MAKYQVLYWQEIPSQVKAVDGHDEVNLPLPARFMERIDKLATERGLGGTDDYLEHWKWSDEKQCTGTAQEVAENIVAQLEAQADW